MFLIFPLSTDLKPENLIYLTKAADSDLVLADFGIAKMLDNKDAVSYTHLTLPTKA